VGYCHIEASLRDLEEIGGEFAGEVTWGEASIEYKEERLAGSLMVKNCKYDHSKNETTATYLAVVRAGVVH
jgi:hypothetical protein